MTVYDIAVVGAGPAGLAAAATAAARGASVAVVDAGEYSGGQYFRHRPGDDGSRHHHWRAFTRLRDGLQHVEHLAGHRVWHAEPGDPHTLHCLVGHADEHPATVRAHRVILATGAYDRSLPFPGWDLPGVLTAGGAQALWKGQGLAAGDQVVVSGTGPFLLPVATGLAASGATVRGVFEANRPDRRVLPLATDPSRAVEAAGYAAALLRHRIPYRTGHAVIAARGDGRLEEVTVARLDRDWHPLPGTSRTIACDTLATGYGFTPQLDLAIHLGCALTEGFDGSPVAAVDAAQATTAERVWAAGETCGVGGATLAMVTGALAGYAATDATPPGSLLRRRTRQRRLAAALAAAWPVRDGWKSWLTDDTLICRCEEVTHRQVRDALAAGARDTRGLKLLSRTGMGRCQGRVCGYAAACLVGAPERPDRPIAQPVRLGDLAAGDTRPSTHPPAGADT